MNKFEQLNIAGEGAYGVVLKCKHKDTGEIVAIKKFRELEEDEETKKMTQREVKLLRALKHENIIQLKEAFRQKGVLYLVFDYVESSLMKVLEESPTGVGAKRTHGLTRQLTCAIEHCHHHSIIHRDIKPENLLIDPHTDTLCLCDFGSACKVIGAPLLTDYVATRWYRAPELLVRSNRYDKSVDVWAVGCVMAELVSGQPLFAGNSDLDQLSLIQKILGPMTSDQMRECLQLSTYVSFRFPEVREPESLKSRFSHQMSTAQLEFLNGIMVMEPSRRLSAKALLQTSWLQGDGKDIKSKAAFTPSVGCGLLGAQNKPPSAYVTTKPPEARHQEVAVKVPPRLVAGISAELPEEDGDLDDSIEVGFGNHDMPADCCDESIPEEIDDSHLAISIEVNSAPASLSKSTPVAPRTVSQPSFLPKRIARPASGKSTMTMFGRMESPSTSMYSEGVNA